MTHSQYNQGPLSQYLTLPHYNRFLKSTKTIKNLVNDPWRPWSEIKLQKNLAGVCACVFSFVLLSLQLSYTEIAEDHASCKDNLGSTWLEWFRLAEGNPREAPWGAVGLVASDQSGKTSQSRDRMTESRATNQAEFQKQNRTQQKITLHNRTELVLWQLSPG